MTDYLLIAGIAAAALLSLFFSCLTYSLREFSRARLADFLGKHDGDKWFDTVTDNVKDLTFVTAVLRQFSNIIIWVMVFAGFELSRSDNLLRWGLTILLVGVIAMFCSVAIPGAAARYAAAEIVGTFAPLLFVLNIIFYPLTMVTRWMDHVMRKALGARDQLSETQIEEEILSAVEEGEKEGVVNEQEREMIESVIEFRDTTAGHIMTTRQEVVALPATATIEEVKKTIEESGHSRIPIHDGSLDHVIGILYARDLMKYLGVAGAQLDVRAAMRPPMLVPETKPLRDLLSEFRLQKVHLAVVLDEYGVTAGVVTVEDVIEELVGEISDEHEPTEPAMFKRLDDRTAEADARLHIDELNRMMGLSIPEDAGYETLGGFLSTSLARIPEKGAVLDHQSVRYTVLEAEPQRAKRIRIEMIAEPAKTG
ncbi:MAG: hemolysin family protein [Tepidisphaeraceae bacterium]|jgi:CBS domain containing-hemolysin-like protein